MKKIVNLFKKNLKKKNEFLEIILNKKNRVYV